MRRATLSPARTDMALLYSDPTHLDRDCYPKLRWQDRCCCGARKTLGLLTCGGHDLDARQAVMRERQLGGIAKMFRPNRRTHGHKPRVMTPAPAIVRARQLFRERGMSGSAIGRVLGRPVSTVNYWLKPLREATV